MIQKIIAILLLILLAPIFLLVSIIVWLDDGHPLLYIQKNYGKNQTVFNLYKFRTMKKGTPSIPTEEMIQPKKYLLRSGNIIRKFSLDELPQFFNVLNGTMNIIGPRPCMIKNEEIINNLRKKYGVDKIKPGITGLAQVNGRDANNYLSKVEWDKKYMENKSLLLDLKIVLKTIYVILIPKNIKH